MVRTIFKGLSVVRLFDPWSSPLCTCPLKLTLNPYTGCGHGCLYCYARSYIKEFSNPRPKSNLIRRLIHDLSIIPDNSLIELSASSDPYTPPEGRLKLTRRVLKIITGRGFRVLITSKSDLVVRDMDLLSNAESSVALTITTLNSEVARMLEPGAPSPDKRLDAISRLSSNEVPVTLRLDPIIPGVNDDVNEIKSLIKEAADAGAVQVTTSTFKARHDSLYRLFKAFPKLRDLLRRLYLKLGERVGGYYYLPKELRLRLILLVREEALRHGLAFASCREGFKWLNTPGIYCDGSTYAFISGETGWRRGRDSNPRAPQGAVGLPLKPEDSSPPP